MTAASSLVSLGFMVVAFVSTFFVGPAATGILPGTLIALAFIVWTQSAYMVFACLLLRDHSKVRGIIASIGSVVVIAWSATLLIDAFLVRPDPQSALILLFLPVPQWIGCAVTMIADVVAAHIEFRDKARSGWTVVKTRLLQLILDVRFDASPSQPALHPTGILQYAYEQLHQQHPAAPQPCQRAKVAGKLEDTVSRLFRPIGVRLGTYRPSAFLRSPEAPQ